MKPTPSWYGNCAFCVRTIGLQGGRLRVHKFDNHVPICPGSNLTDTEARELFSKTHRQLIADLARRTP